MALKPVVECCETIKTTLAADLADEIRDDGDYEGRRKRSEIHKAAMAAAAVDLVGHFVVAIQAIAMRVEERR